MSDIRLEVDAIGDGPAVILLHPVGLDRRFWGDLPAMLADRCRVVAVDLAGHGGSPPVKAPRAMEAYAAEIHAIIARIGGPAIVVGQSFGGMIAQTLALDYPDDVAALALCACPGDFSDELRPMLRERGLAAERGGMAAVVGATLERWFTPAFRDDPAVARVREHLLRLDPDAWSAGWHAIAGFAAIPRLGKVTAPTLVLGGASDLATPPAAAKALADAIPGARLEMLPGAPHMMQIETQPAFRRAIARFIGGMNGE